MDCVHLIAENYATTMTPLLLTNEYVCRYAWIISIDLTDWSM